MLLKYFYDPALAHASYLVGCQRERAAIIVDPGRDIDQYLAVAEDEGMKLVGVAETHIHADYVSGARELAERVGAKLYLSDEGPAAWKYKFAEDYDAQLLKDGDEFQLGRIKFQVMHTPGHTPESVSFLLTDEGGGADGPMGIFTGDFVFVGAIGRPDLLERAAGVTGSAAAGALDLFRSVQRFRSLPDYLQVWPAHGAGSACGKGLGAIPSSTVGYEKRFNPALQFHDEAAFVEYVLADQPEAPKYFAVMKRVNKEGPRVLGELTPPQQASFDELKTAAADSTLLDIREASVFSKAHTEGAINIPASMLAAWAGWLVDYDRPVSLIADPSQVAEAVRVLNKIGLDDIRRVFDVTKLRDMPVAVVFYPNQSPTALAPMIESQAVQLVDVRTDAEWSRGRLPNAKHQFLGRLTEHLDDLSFDHPVIVQCQKGGRSAIAASLLQNAGHEVINMSGGFDAWVKAGLPIQIDDPSEAAASACTIKTGGVS